MKESRDLLRLRLLGGCEIATAAGVVHLESAKTTALLAFLAVTRSTHSRAKLAGLLWPELSEERAATALRRALWDLKRRLSPPGRPPVVLATRESVAFNASLPHDLDVEAFLAALARQDADAGPGPQATASAAAAAGEDEVERLERATGSYRGDLLDGVFVDSAPAFEEWLLVERERLRSLALAALRRLVELLRHRGEPARALAHARHLLALDSWLEEGHCAVAELLALTGQRGAALTQLETCRHLLAVELGVPPAPATVALESRLRADAGSAASPGSPAVTLARHNLPLPATPFVGRHEELDVIARHLDDPDCRLLTLLGPGGIGKTRLALQAAYRLLGGGEGEGAFAPNAIVFVPPAEATGPEPLADALATALNLPPGASGEASDRVRDALRGRCALLLLDGCEHRLGDISLLAELLAAAPEVKALATSRERLQLAEESVLEVGGLAVPRRDQRPDAARFPALGLFLKAASRARVGFAASGDALEAVADVCRLLDGLPLAIEMAAAWMQSLAPRELRDELARGFDVLTSPLRSAPAGQASLRAVFDHSFGRLAPDEQRVVRALSVLSGGMTGEAAWTVGRASPGVLRRLVDRSFLRLETSSGRWALHEVLRYFAGVHLADAPDERGEVCARHAAFFLAFLREREDDLAVRADRDAMATVAAELDNIRAAWAWAVAGGDGGLLTEALPALAAYCAASGRFRDGERLISQAVEVLSTTDTTSRSTGLTRALLARGGLRNNLGRYDDAAADLDEALSDLPEADAAGRSAALFHLGDGAMLQGRFAEAHTFLAESIDLARACGASRTLADALGRLGRAVLDEGRHGEARALFAESLDAARAAGNRPAELYAANQLGFVAYFDGALNEAEQRFSATLPLAREADDRLAACTALDGLGFVAEDLGRLDQAATCYHESLRIRQEIGDRFGAGRVLMWLGEVARRQSQFEVARRRYHESLTINCEIGSRYICGLLSGNLAYVAAAEGRGDEARDHIRATLLAYRDTGSATVGLPALVSLAEVIHAAGDTPRALALLGLVLAHAGIRQDHRTEVERVLSRIRRDSPDGDEAAALAAGRTLTLAGVAAEVLAELPAPSGPPPAADP